MRMITSFLSYVILPLVIVLDLKIEISSDNYIFDENYMVYGNKQNEFDMIENEMGIQIKKRLIISPNNRISFIA